MIGGHEWGFFTGGFMWILWIVLIALLIWFAKDFFAGTPSQEKSKTALDILNERYARGEIEQQEFEQKRSELDL
ncbi:MAG: SHOCT domain-containing protein [gamma proteobacterium symbiont of Bathyaustriella thionipta]|nr:SHOCT domain-containing protein [gamma proteobacterium symbiont of Bathyaustriella thionipta]